ncbi:MAG: CsiV family protein [Pseudomonadota bacterium]
MSLHEKPFKLLLLPFFVLFFSPALQAQEETRWYEVEVLLFEQQSESYRQSEEWPLDFTEPELEGSRELSSTGSFRRLSNTELKRQGDADRIKSAADLKLLAHFGWRQPGLSREEAVPLRIEEVPGLSGTLTLILSRYLHIETDLLYRETEEHVYRLEQSRRMRSGELHYLDHPVLGIAIEVRRAEAP